MQINKKKARKTIIYTGIITLLFFIYYFLYLKYNFGIPCIFHRITGFLCPGCGITRCIFALLNGNFRQAFYYNQFVFCLLPIFIIYSGYNLYRYLFDKKMIEVPNILINILVFLAVLFGIIRNVL